MRRLIGLFILVGAVVLVASAVAQQQKQAQASTAPSVGKEEKPKIERFIGVIEKVDEIAKTIDVKGKVRKQEKVVTFPADDHIKITRAGKEMSLSDLKKGMAVSVEYRREGDKMVAVAVKVSAPKAGPRKEQPDT